jgi:tetratricopeptide (TPR) repeat protein
MNKLFLLMAVSLMATATYAQDIKDIRNYTLLGQTQKAKELIDKYLTVPKNAAKGEGWYYKGFIYNQASKDSTKSITESAALKATAFEALKKYRELDPKAELLAEQNNSPLYDLYVGYYSELGVKAYVAKDPATAFEDFKKALEVHDYISANNLVGNNGFKFSALDTMLTLYTAIAANEAKKLDESTVYYKKITDAQIADPQFIDAYQVLADRYKASKDKAAFAEIIAKGKKLFPSNNEFWTAIEIEEATDGIGKPEIFTKYDELMVKNPGNYTLPYNYGVELYRYIYSDEAKNVNTNDFKTKLPVVLKQAIAIKNTSEANFLLSNFLYNNSIDIFEEARKMKAVKPDELKKKKELQAQSDAQMNQAIPYAEAVIALFPGIAKPKGSEKVNYKQSLVILKNIYETKKDTAKVASYEKQISEAQ